MKKITSILIALLIMVSFVACENTSAPTSNPPASNELNDLDALSEKYLAPLVLAGITIDSWSNANEILPPRIAIFYAAVKDIEDGVGQTNWDTAALDASDVETLVQKYFDVSTDVLHDAPYYDAASNTYKFESLGGAAGFGVVGANRDGSKLILSYEYYSPADDVTVIREGELTINIDGNDYKYVSCTTNSVD